MSEADFREALRLLDAAVALLERSREGPTAESIDALQRLTVELDLLRLRAGQVPPEERRN